MGNVVTADQDSAWNRHGELYYEDLRLLEVRVPVWRSDDGGQSWSGPSEAVSELRTGIHIDRPWLSVDNTGDPRDGTVYLTWETMFYQPCLPGVFERSSTDGGRTWGPIVRVDRGVQRTQWDPRAKRRPSGPEASFATFTTWPLCSHPPGRNSSRSRWSSRARRTVARANDGD